MWQSGGGTGRLQWQPRHCRGGAAAVITALTLRSVTVTSVQSHYWHRDAGLAAATELSQGDYLHTSHDDDREPIDTNDTFTCGEKARGKCPAPPPSRGESECLCSDDRARAWRRAHRDAAASRLPRR